jgi:hypothetical protein
LAPQERPMAVVATLCSTPPVVASSSTATVLQCTHAWVAGGETATAIQAV